LQELEGFAPANLAQDKCGPDDDEELLSGGRGLSPFGSQVRLRDALIAMSAARLGITVITAKARDFLRLVEFRPFQWRVHVF
jgi:predicted nucleic acid-binding protein